MLREDREIIAFNTLSPRVALQPLATLVGGNDDRLGKFLNRNPGGAFGLAAKMW